MYDHLQQQARLQQFLWWLIPIDLFFGVLLAALGIHLHTTPLLLLGCVYLVLACSFVGSYLLQRRHFTLAVGLLGGTLLIAPILTTLLLPMYYFIAMLGPLVVAVISIQYFDGTRMYQILGACFVTIIATLLMGLIPPFPFVMPRILFLIMGISAFSAGSGLFLLLLGQFSQRQTAIIRKLQCTNKELEHARATLESQVAERTADLNAALIGVQSANTQLDQALTEVKGSNIRLQGLVNFARFMQHEVRGYAAGIEGMTPILRRALLGHPNGEDYLQHLGGLEETVTQMNELTQQMLILSREGVLPDPQRQAVPLLPLLEQVRTKALAFAQHHDLPIHISITATPEVEVLGDPLYLSLAFYTGLRNAVEVLSGQDQDTDAKVDVTITHAEQHIRVALRDNGPGFPAALLDTIALAQQSASGFVIGWTNKVGGSGLGLALMDQVARLHGGSLAIGNRKNQSGAWVELTLPS